jgi:hypothetical protein
MNDKGLESDPHSDKKENKMFLIDKEIRWERLQSHILYEEGGFLIYEEMRKYLFIYEEAIR